MPQNKKTYLSTGQNPFDSWRIWYMVAFVFSFTFYVLDFPGILNPIIEGIIFASLVVLLISLLRVSRISNSRNGLKCNSILESEHIQKIEKIETWWSYDLGGVSPGIVTGVDSDSKQTINYIYIFARIMGDGKFIILYELIQMGDKFPNNHPYKEDGFTEGMKKFKVWDVDKCLEQLDLKFTPAGEH